ncbi:MAG: O-methyltransferase [Halanaeroarchaeum sp.]
MSDVLDATVESVLALGSPDPGQPIADMEAYADDHDFPIVGADVGRFFRTIATMVDAERIFEFGSGFGYSAVWFAAALPADGEIVLTDYDATNRERARAFLDRADYGDRARIEGGDALETVRETSGDFDVVLIDHEKHRYTEAFDAIADRLSRGGVVLADNVLAGPTDPAAVEAALEGESPRDEATAGVAAYLETVRDHPAFETAIVPLGEGVAVSVRRD